MDFVYQICPGLFGTLLKLVSYANKHAALRSTICLSMFMQVRTVRVAIEKCTLCVDERLATRGLAKGRDGHIRFTATQHHHLLNSMKILPSPTSYCFQVQPRVSNLNQQCTSHLQTLKGTGLEASWAGNNMSKIYPFAPEIWIGLLHPSPLLYSKL